MGGTEAFPDLGRHCQRSDCHQLDFLPFKCDGFSNSSTCKTCQMKVCLKHRFPADHVCRGAKAGLVSAGSAVVDGVRNGNFLMALTQRNGKDCGKSGRAGRTSPPRTPRSTKAY